MKRLTTDRPSDNFSTMMNYVFGREGFAHIRHDGEDIDVPLALWAEKECNAKGCEFAPHSFDQQAIDETICDCLMESPRCPVALAYAFACQAVHLRDRLKAIEDILGEEYELEQLHKLVATPVKHGGPEVGLIE